MPREELQEGSDKAMLKERWAGAVDTVGGEILFNVVKSLRYGASVACCGLTAGMGFKGNVAPFILRGVNLLGGCSGPEDVRAAPGWSTRRAGRASSCWSRTSGSWGGIAVACARPTRAIWKRS